MTLTQRYQCSLSSRLLHLQGGVERVEQGGLAEWLEQAFVGSVCEEPWTIRRIGVGGNEDNGNLLAPADQFLLQLGSRHPRHRDVEEETTRLTHETRGEKRFSRGKCRSGKAEQPQEIWERLAHGLVIVDDRHQRRLLHHDVLNSGAASR